MMSAKVCLVLCLLALVFLPQLPGVSAENNDDPYLQMMMYQKYFNNSGPPFSLPSMWMCAIVSLGVFAVARRIH